MTAIEVLEFTDPGCSWAWGSEPKLRRLRWRFGDRLAWRRVLGGLVGDMERYREQQPAAASPGTLADYWREVYSHTQMSYPPGLQRVTRSTEPAGKAVKAAGLQSDEVAGRVLRRLREQTFIFGEPPDTPDRILATVGGVEGLDPDQLGRDLGSVQVEKLFREDWNEARQPNDYVMHLEGDRPGIGRACHSEGHWRYVFPTLVFRGPGGEATVAGWEPYDAYEAGLESAGPGSTAAPRPDPSPAEVFATWPTACDTELDFLCGRPASPPPETVAFDWGEGTFYLTPPEARARGLAPDPDPAGQA
ncbi:MAG: DsbA family oxidoreductase [Acidimicrobiia bacterium]